MRKLALILISVFISGCTGAINDFVAGGGNSIGPTPPNPPDPTLPRDESTQGFKLSPGSVTSTSGGVNMRATITPTHHMMTSPGANAQMSLHSSPTK